MIKKIFFIFFVVVFFSAGSGVYASPLILEMGIECRTGNFSFDNTLYADSFQPFLKELLIHPETRITLFVNINTILSLQKSPATHQLFIKNKIKSGQLRFAVRLMRISDDRYPNYLTDVERIWINELSGKMEIGPVLLNAPPSPYEKTPILSNPWGDFFSSSLAGNDTNLFINKLRETFIGTTGDTIHLRPVVAWNNLVENFNPEGLRVILHGIHNETWLNFGFAVSDVSGAKIREISIDDIPPFYTSLLNRSISQAGFIKKHTEGFSTSTRRACGNIQELFSLEFILALENNFMKNNDMLPVLLEVLSFIIHPPPRKSGIYLKDINHDNKKEFILFNRKIFAVLTSEGARLLYWFNLDSGDFIGSGFTDKMLINNTSIGSLMRAHYVMNVKKDYYEFVFSLPYALLSKRFSLEDDKILVDYRIKNVSDKDNTFDFKFDGFFSPGYKSVLKEGVSSFYFKNKHRLSRTVDTITDGIFNPSSRTGIRVKFFTNPDGLEGLIEHEGVRFNPVFSMKLSPGKYARFGMFFQQVSKIPNLKKSLSSKIKTKVGYVFPETPLPSPYPVFSLDKSSFFYRYPVELSSDTFCYKPSEVFFIGDKNGPVFQVNFKDIFFGRCDTDFIMDLYVYTNHNLPEKHYIPGTPGKIRILPGWNFLIRYKQKNAELILADGRRFTREQGIRFNKYARTLNIFIPSSILESPGDRWNFQLIMRDPGDNSRVYFIKPESEPRIMAVDFPD